MLEEKGGKLRLWRPNIVNNYVEEMAQQKIRRCRESDLNLNDKGVHTHRWIIVSLLFLKQTTTTKPFTE